MGIGSTTDKGDPKDNIAPEVLTRSLTDKDADMKTMQELIGVQKDMRAGYEKLHHAKLSLNQKATVEGCLAEVAVVKQQLEMTHEQLRALIGIYGTMKAEFDHFKLQRVKELNVKVNGGSTTPEDTDGSDIKSSN